MRMDEWMGAEVLEETTCDDAELQPRKSFVMMSFFFFNFLPYRSRQTREALSIGQ